MRRIWRRILRSNDEGPLSFLGCDAYYHHGHMAVDPGYSGCLMRFLVGEHALRFGRREHFTFLSPATLTPQEVDIYEVPLSHITNIATPNRYQLLVEWFVVLNDGRERTDHVLIEFENSNDNSVFGQMIWHAIYEEGEHHQRKLEAAGVKVG